MSTLQALTSTPLRTEFSPTGVTATAVPASRVQIRVAGVDFDDVTMAETVERIVWMACQTDHPRHVCTGNLDHLVILEKDASFRTAYDTADLVVADGMPIVWLSHGRDRKPLRERVTGSDLFWELGRVSAQEGIRLFFLGGVPGSADLAADAVRERYPLAQITGTYCPAFETFHTDQEQQRIREEITRTRPDILLVGLGAPKQEKWIVENKERLGVPVSIGVGGTFEMASGIQRRAPRWMQRTGLEWCYRMFRDPKRLARRYLGQDLPFLLTLLARNARETNDYMARLRRTSGGAL